MIVTIILLGITLLSIIFIIIDNEYLDLFGYLGTVFGSLGLIISIIMIIASHIAAPEIIQENKLEYDSLCKRYQIIESEYEDVSKSDIIADITTWNTKVYNTKYWADNPWTNWFNPKEIADNLNYILLE